MNEIEILGWNVNGYRAALRKGFMEWLRERSPDIICLQETKAWREQVQENESSPDGYFSYWSKGEKKGYSGVAVFSKVEPREVLKGFGIDRFDREGRVLILRYDQFTLFNIYYPNGQGNADRLSYKLDFYDAFLDFAEEEKRRGNPLVITGDFNTAHTSIDLARPRENENISGFLPVERAWLDKFVKSGYIDTFRTFHPEPNQYSWWSYRTRARERNVGWGLDYFFATPEIMDNIEDSFILSDIEGSDHCPVGLKLRI